MTYPMWNPSKTGILTTNEEGGIAFLESGPQFDALKGSASNWVEPEPEVSSPEDVAAALVQRRASMPPISPLQGILTLGEVEWGKVLSYRNHADTTWAERVIIDNASDWVRTSQNIAFFGHLLDYTAEQMDTLFIAAAQVRA